MGGSEWGGDGVGRGGWGWEVGEREVGGGAECAEMRRSMGEAEADMEEWRAKAGKAGRRKASL